MQRSVYIGGIKSRVRDTDNVLINPDDYSRALDTALRQLAHDRPLMVDSAPIAYAVTEDAVADNVPLCYMDAVLDYAAGLLLTELAAYYAGDSDSTINADSVDRQSKEQRYSKMASVYSGRYFERVGVSKAHNTHASATADLPRKRPRNLTLTNWLEV
jgi:hypothetical protein